MHLYMPSLAMNLYTLSKTMGAMTISPPFLVKRVLCICSIAGMPLPLVWEPQNLCEMPLLEVTREVARLWSMPCYRLSMEYFGVSSVFIFILELWPPSYGTFRYIRVDQHTMHAPHKSPFSDQIEEEWMHSFTHFVSLLKMTVRYHIWSVYSTLQLGFQNGFQVYMYLTNLLESVIPSQILNP